MAINEAFKKWSGFTASKGKIMPTEFMSPQTSAQLAALFVLGHDVTIHAWGQYLKDDWCVMVEIKLNPTGCSSTFKARARSVDAAFEELRPNLLRVLPETMALEVQ